ncbi:MAG: flavodoxin family protein [Eubacteriales bacterium]|nr:flavodoxin family protein [Eubacteriales bacterium]MDD4389511.1 flavodoxin family protein [Eubacteriales bacterium]
MKVLLINGSPNEHRCTYTALWEIAKTLNKHEIETEIMQIGKKPVAGCIDCRTCKKTGVCAFNDAVNETIAKLPGIDAIVIGSPVYFASPNGQLVSFLDRLFFSAGSRMSGKLGASVVSCRRGGASAAFDTLNKYFTISNMPIVSSQYWNQVHGRKAEEVLRDEEGLQTMRTLGENMAWLLKSIECGRKSGITLPQYEDEIATDFIR